MFSGRAELSPDGKTLAFGKKYEVLLFHFDLPQADSWQRGVFSWRTIMPKIDELTPIDRKSTSKVINILKISLNLFRGIKVKGTCCSIIFYAVFMIAGCVSWKYDMCRHSFRFDLDIHSPDMEVLDYQYGSSRQFCTYKEFEGAITKRSISGVMARGEFLYVKWRDKQSGQVFEDRVDFSGRLPAKLTGYTVTFFVKGPQLYVYLLSPHKDRRPSSWPEGPMKLFRSLKQYEIYPSKTDWSFLGEHPVFISRRERNE